MFRDFVAEKGFDVNYDELKQEEKLRANRLMTPDYCWSPDKGGDRWRATFATEFSKFRDKCKKKKNGFFTPNFFNNNGSTCRVFFNESAIDRYLVIRRQRGTICYMHSGALLQHYLECIRTLDNGKANHTMLDLSTYIRETMTKDKLLQYLNGTGGGSSIEFFCSITGIKELASLHLPTEFISCGVQNPILEYFHKFKEPVLFQMFRSRRHLRVTDTATSFLTMQFPMKSSWITQKQNMTSSTRCY